MTVFKTIVVIIFLLLVLMTAITEPMLSLEYGKALAFSGKAIVAYTVHKVKDIVEYSKVAGNSG